MCVLSGTRFATCATDKTFKLWNLVDSSWIGEVKFTNHGNNSFAKLAILANRSNLIKMQSLEDLRERISWMFEEYDESDHSVVITFSTSKKKRSVKCFRLFFLL